MFKRIAFLCGMMLAIVASVVLAFSQWALLIRPLYQAAAQADYSSAFYTYKVQKISDITYCQPGGEPQKLNLYLPIGGRQAHPLVVYVHGGAWLGGDKESGFLDPYLPQLAKAGYVVAAINYRLAPAHTFPAPIIDAKCAIRFLHASADRYHIDTKHTAIAGESAGGYVASFVALTPGNPGYTSAEYANQPDAVQAAITVSAPSDFTVPASSAYARKLVQQFIGGASPAEASPINHVTASSPPLMIVHGTADQLVPLSQSARLVAKLQQSGRSPQYIPVKGVGHYLDDATLSGIDPPLNVIEDKLLSFLDSNLR